MSAGVDFYWLILAALIAAAVSHVGARAAAASGPMHAPRKGRSSHEKITPSGGGLGIVAGTAAALLAVALARPVGVEAVGALQLSLLTAIGLAVATVGVLDDLYDWPPRLKFALLGASSAAIVLVAGAPTELPLTKTFGAPLGAWLALAGAALWIFTAKNAVNFMDGANGLVGGTMSIASAGLAVVASLAGAPEAALAAAALAGALAGFLPVNAPAARVFMGDAGSLFAGAWFAGASLLFIAEAPRGAVYLPPLLLLPILADVLLTLAWHVKHKIPLLKPHLDHAYQMRIRAGESHFMVVRTIWARAALFALIAVGAALAALGADDPIWTLFGLLAGVIAACAWWRHDRMMAPKIA